MGQRKKIIFVQTKAIGHLMCELDLFIKEAILGLRENFHGTLYASPSRFANRHIIRYWQDFPDHLNIIDRDLEYGRIPAIPNHADFYFDCHQEYMVRLNQTARYPEIIRQWGHRPPLLKLKPEDAAYGWSALKKAGIPEGAPFFLFHSRESNYDQLGYNDFRNTTLENFLPAVEYLTSLGYWCIRMGDRSMRPLPKLPSRVFDYANSNLRGDEERLNDRITMPGGFKDIVTIDGRMDVFLGATAKGFLNSNSGVGMLSQTFGVPVCWSNLAPASFVPFYGSNDISLPKLMWSEPQGRYLTFPEVFASPIANFRGNAQFEANRIKAIENSAEDILDAAKELVEIAEGKVAYTLDDDSRQQTWKSLLKPGHFSYKPAARIGRAFLKNFSYLLSPNTDQTAVIAQQTPAIPAGQQHEHHTDRARRILIKYGHLFTPGPNSAEFMRQVADCLAELGETETAKALYTAVSRNKLRGVFESAIKSGMGLVPEGFKSWSKRQIAKHL